MLVITPFPYVGWASYLDGVRGEVLGSAPGLSRISNQHYTFPMLGCQKDNAGGFEGTAYLIASVLADLESVDSRRFSAVRATRALSASMSCVHPRSARAARTWREVIIHDHLQCRRGI